MDQVKPMGLLQYLGLSQEEQQNFQAFQYMKSNSSRRRGGRKKLKYSIDERRTYCLWLLANQVPPKQRAKITNRSLIEKAKTMPFGGLFKNTTSQATLEQSVSRGKRALAIDREWNSEVCVFLEQQIHKLRD